ncbi:type II toxin-antitoxin system RelE/ParE family toxin [Flavobacterium sp. GA093]|uniref:Type II toxin-antitoxin system RelE/ParE family toxin n=1 Tax=Flavobacterium hydrocarbonoxydans TaxID=2683249 RepID=A0A6I4NUN3_9FLAO|nr:type II toxin-antitoxin system RelE/ParE family toxin [Flavobacterium hydrocarbonoxydans]MWB94797.1 type II toxin-antitoxin system RelE/ParE family toxin [Flavobacterium hydrocarbonoxydans]
MKIRFQEEFLYTLEKQVHYISNDKPLAARKFKNDLLRNIKKDLRNPFHFKKSQYFNDEYIRDYVFKGYVITYYIDESENYISVFGFIKYKDSF